MSNRLEFIEHWYEKTDSVSSQDFHYLIEQSQKSKHYEKVLNLIINTPDIGKIVELVETALEIEKTT